MRDEEDLYECDSVLGSSPIYMGIILKYYTIRDTMKKRITAYIRVMSFISSSSDDYYSVSCNYVGIGNASRVRRLEEVFIADLYIHSHRFIN